MRLEDIQTRSALDYASGTADRNGTTIDVANYEWAKFKVHFATIAVSGTNSVKLQGSDDDSTWSDLEGTSQSVAVDDDNQIFVIGLIKPRHRYARLVIDKDGTNAAAESATVELGGARTLPALADVTDEVTHEVHVSPAAGTA